jgi:hypothetical protein
VPQGRNFLPSDVSDPKQTVLAAPTIGFRLFAELASIPHAKMTSCIIDLAGGS